MNNDAFLITEKRPFILDRLFFKGMHDKGSSSSLSITIAVNPLFDLVHQTVCVKERMIFFNSHSKMVRYSYLFFR